MKKVLTFAAVVAASLSVVACGNNSGKQIEILVQYYEVGTAALFQNTDVVKAQILCGNLGHGLNCILKGHTVADNIFKLFIIKKRTC